ncbi:MAG: hypothetical protein RL291_52 [Pseudomonadota bacterium]
MSSAGGGKQAAVSNADDQNFLSRWSRRKVAARRGEPVEEVVEPVDAGAAAEAHAADPVAGQVGAPGAKGPRALTEEDFKDVDFDALTYQSDYSRFLEKGVPESIRQKALQKLWVSDPLFTAVDPFQDYAGDFTDQALAVPTGALKSAYKMGQGFLSDEEAKTWDDLGKTPDEPKADAALAAAPGGAVAARALMPGYLVRPATSADAADLASVAQLALAGDFTKLHGVAFARGLAHRASVEALTAQMAEGLVLDVAIDQDSGKLIGFCGGVERDITWHIVWPQHGRKGVGAALLRHVEARLGPGELNPNVLGSRLSAGLLKRLGYGAIAEQVVETPTGASATLVVMRRG